MTMKKPSRSLARMLFYAVALFSILTSYIFSFIYSYYDYRHEIASLKSSILQIEKSHVQIIEDSLWKMDRQQVDVALNGIHNIPHIGYVAIRHGNEVIASAGEPVAGEAISKEFNLSYEYNSRDVPLGVLRIEAGTDSIWKNLLANVGKTLLREVVVIFMITLFVFILFQYLVTRHLAAIADYFLEADLADQGKPLLLNRRPIPDELGNVVASINSMREKSAAYLEELERANAAVRESEEKYRSLVENANDSITVIQSEQTVYRNPAYEKLIGFAADETREHGFLDIVAPEERGRVREHYFNRLKGEYAPEKYELDLITKRGRRLTMEVKPCLIRYNGETATMVVMRDISERKEAEKALRASEEKYRSLVEHSTDIIMRFDRDCRLLFVSPSVTAVVSSKPDELIDKTLRELGLPEDRCRFWEEGIASVLETGRAFETEFELHGSNGLQVFNWRLFPEFDERGRTVTVMSVARNITKERRSEENYRMLFDKMLDGFALHEIICDNGGKPYDYRFLGINPAFEQLTGLRTSAVVGRTVSEVLPGIDSDWIETYGRVALTGDPIRFEKYSREIGKYFEILAFSPQTGQFACIFQDITKRKEAEEELDKFFNISHDLLCIAGLDGYFKRLNPAWEDALGYTREELRARPYLDFVHPDDLQATLTEAGSIVNGMPISNFTNRYRCKDGSYRWLYWTGVPDLEVKLVYAVARDVTEMRLAEEKSERMEVQLRQAQKMEAIGTLAGGIAHDFNNILAAIIGYTEMVLADTPTSSPAKHDLQQVLNAGHRAKDLVRQILAFSRQKYGREQIPVEIAPIVKEALKLLRASLPTTIDIRLDIESERGTVLADPTQLHQILINLCTNAAHAMGETGGVLEVGLADVDILDSDTAGLYSDIKPGPYLRLAVSDTGHGMDPQTLERIFDPYFTTKEVGKGSGLGLAVVHGIVKHHGGAISVMSEPGKGTIFFVYFPRIKNGGSVEDGKAKPVPKGTECVLLVDDEEALAEVGKRMLQRLGYTVVAKTSSMEALELFRTEPRRFDLVITDYTMPQLTGIDLAKEIMSIRSDIPVVLCTGFSERVTEQQSKDMGIEAFVLKPLNLSEIALVIRKVLDKQAQPHAGG